MLKLFSIVFISFIVSGCMSQSTPKKSHNMFQSVSLDSASLVKKGKDRRYCSQCGMDLVKFYKTSHAATSGKNKDQYCSIHCLVDHKSKDNALSDYKVVDVTSLKLVDTKVAYYVVGSSVRGTMSRVSKYAFLNIDDAKNFQAKYDGDIMRFDEAFEIAKEDF